MSKLTAAAGLAWQIAAAEAASARHPFIEREHLLIGVCSLHKTVSFVRFVKTESLPLAEIRAEADRVEETLAAMGITSTAMRRGVRTRLRPGHTRHTEPVVHRSESCREIFRRAQEIAEREEAGETSAFHLLLAVFSDPGPILTAVLTGAGIQPGSIQPEFPPVLPLGEKPESRSGDAGTMVTESETAATNTPMLDRYGRDITRAAREGRLLPFVESERTRNTLRQLLKVLVMPTKNNPVLVGEAGVGKTAIVEALAERVATGATGGCSQGRGSWSFPWRNWSRAPSTAGSSRNASRA